MISLGNPYLKILDLSKLFDADAHVKEIKKWFYSTSEHFVLRGGEIAHLLEGLWNSLYKAIFFTYRPLLTDWVTD